MGSTFYQLCPRNSGTLTPTALMAIRLWETFTFLGGTVVVKSSVVPQRPYKVAGYFRLDWIYVYVLLLCMQDETVDTGDMN